MFKRTISSILIASMLMVLNGCGSSSKTNTNPSPSPSPSTATPAPAKTEPVQVVFWDMVVGGQKYPELAGKLASEITKDLPNITIKYQSIPWANRYETFSTAIAAKTGPDFSTGGGYQSFQFAGANEILDISSVVNQWKTEGTLNNYDQNLIKYFQYKDMQVGIPWNYEPRYILYRKDWFQKDNIKVPTNWDELYAAATHFTDKSKGTYGFAYPTSNSSGNVLFNLWFAMNGTGVWAADGKTPDWTNPKNLQALDFITKMQKAGVFPEGLSSYEDTNVIQLALQDKVSMVMISMGNNGAQIKTAGAQDKWGLLPVPSGPSANGNQGYVAAINAIMAYKQTKHPEETKKALKWWCENMFKLWTNPEAQVSGMPVRQDWLKDPKFTGNTADPYLPEYVKNVLPKTHSLIYPATNISGWLTQNQTDSERWWTALSQAVLQGNKTSQQLLQEWQDKALKAMKDNGETAK